MVLTKLPLLIDAHFHARDLKQKHKGTFETETKAALLGGVGTVLAMPNTDPYLTTRSAIVMARHIAEQRLYCDLGFYFGTVGTNLGEFEHFKPPRYGHDFVKGLKFYLDPTTGGMNISLDVAKRVFMAWNNDLPLLVHCEGGELTSKVIRLAEKYGRRVHICHVNLAEQVNAIRKAKQDGVDVTAEVTPHHLIFTEQDRERLGGYGFMKPPLATAKDVEALWAALRDQTIDIIATDHAPHSQREKEEQIPPSFGIISEPVFPVLWTHFSMRGWPVKLLIQLMHTKPAQIFGIQVDTNSFMEVDLDGSFVLEPEMIQSKAHSPYTGMQLWGLIQTINLHGIEVVRDRKIVAKNGKLI